MRVGSIVVLVVMPTAVLIVLLNHEIKVLKEEFWDSSFERTVLRVEFREKNFKSRALRVEFLE